MARRCTSIQMTSAFASRYRLAGMKLAERPHEVTEARFATMMIENRMEPVTLSRFLGGGNAREKVGGGLGPSRMPESRADFPFVRLPGLRRFDPLLHHLVPSLLVGRIEARGESARKLRQCAAVRRQHDFTVSKGFNDWKAVALVQGRVNTEGNALIEGREHAVIDVVDHQDLIGCLRIIADVRKQIIDHPTGTARKHEFETRCLRHACGHQTPPNLVKQTVSLARL